ncbi:integrase [Betaproteobacteria bacterium]|nr:integrase [Betaproteobacteria bacterium]
MALSDAFLRNYKPKGMDKKQADGDGLFVLLKANGGKWWRFSYRHGGKQKTLSIGTYPDVSIREARERRDAARKLLAQGIDPGEDRKVKKAEAVERGANTFETVARAWFDIWKNGKADATARHKLAALENDIFPTLGDVPVTSITPPMVLKVLRHMESRGVGNSVAKAKTAISQVMLHAIQEGKAERNPCPDLRGALKVPPVKHMAAITDPVKVGELLRLIDAYEGMPEVRAALQLAPLVFVRPGELIAARWADIDLDRATWKYFVTKTKTEHLVPLAKQAVAILAGLKAVSRGGEWVFLGEIPKRHISNVTLNAALRRMGYSTTDDMSAHGFRALARTLLAEELHIPPEVIEHQLAHAVPDTLGRAYNRTRFLKERTAMMQAWADYLDRLKTGADVIPLRA